MCIILIYREVGKKTHYSAILRRYLLISHTISPLLFRNIILVALDTHVKNNKYTLDICGVGDGVHGNAWCLLKLCGGSNYGFGFLSFLYYMTGAELLSLCLSTLFTLILSPVVL